MIWLSNEIQLSHHLGFQGRYDAFEQEILESKLFLQVVETGAFLQRRCSDILEQSADFQTAQLNGNFSIHRQRCVAQILKSDLLK